MRPAFLALLAGAFAALASAATSPPPSRRGDPRTAARVELGRTLFFDPRLSRDGTVSCASCHSPARGWADGRPVSVGIGGTKGRRNAPTIVNASVVYYNELSFWDGRASGLEAQAREPLLDPDEMGNTESGVESTVRLIPGYDKLFDDAFGDRVVTFARIVHALSEFERALEARDSPYDRFRAGDEQALSPAARRGMQVFLGKGSCAACHIAPDFSDSEFHNIGIGQKKTPPDLGRFEVTHEDRDRGAYRTPNLRQLRYTAPYMHDGSMATLEEVIDFYDRGGDDNAWMDPDVQPLHLSAQEKKDLLAFLDALNAPPPKVEGPKRLPK